MHDAARAEAQPGAPRLLLDRHRQGQIGPSPRKPPGFACCSAFPKTRPWGVAASTRRISKSGVSPTRIEEAVDDARVRRGAAGSCAAPCAGPRVCGGRRRTVRISSGRLAGVVGSRSRRSSAPAALAVHAELDAALANVGDRHRVEAALDGERQILEHGRGRVERRALRPAVVIRSDHGDRPLQGADHVAQADLAFAGRARW